MTRTVTTEQLAEVIRPFAGKRLNGDLSASISIEARGGNYSNADVRSVRGGYVEVFFYSACDLVPLANIERVVVRGMDARGNVTGTTAYEHVGARRRAA
jgi:hypothetical protein